MNSEKAINRLRDMLTWSDRIGSDEVYEIVQVMNILSKGKRFNAENILKNWRNKWKPLLQN